MEHREKQIIRVSVIGIIANIILAGLKFTVGFFAHSVSIMIDAVNNTSDVMSSVITILGTKLAGRPADKSHPYGHGRVEYLTAAIISAIVLYAGVTALIEAVKEIFSPKELSHSPLTLSIIAAGVIVKFFLGRYVSSEGQKLSSDALKNSGQDAIMDSAVSSSTLIGAIVFLVFGISIEGWLGVFISIFIIRAVLDMFLEATSKILGERTESSIAKAIKDTVCETEGVLGAYDLILTNYGPDRLIGSIHIEVPDEWTAGKIDTVTRKITHKVAVKHHIILAAVGIYSKNTASPQVMEIRDRITKAVMSLKYILGVHGFYCEEDKKEIRFDVVVDFSAPNTESVKKKVHKTVRNLYPDYNVNVQIDSDYSD